LDGLWGLATAETLCSAGVVSSGGATPFDNERRDSDEVVGATAATAFFAGTAFGTPALVVLSAFPV
jgi:hypothetical protein